MSQYNQEEINFLAYQKDQKEFEKEDWEKLEKIIWQLTGKSLSKIIRQLL